MNKALQRTYTTEELQQIRANLKRACNVDHIPFMTDVRSLYKHRLHIIHCQQYYYCRLYSSKAFTGISIGVHKIRITYKRSGVVFFKFVDDKSSREYYCDEQSDFAAKLIPAKIALSEFGVPDANIDIIKFDKLFAAKHSIDIVLNSGQIMTI